MLLDDDADDADVVGCCWMLLDGVGCCWMLLDVVGCCWMLLDDGDDDDDDDDCCCLTIVTVEKGIFVISAIYLLAAT